MIGLESWSASWNQRGQDGATQAETGTLEAGGLKPLNATGWKPVGRTGWKPVLRVVRAKFSTLAVVRGVTVFANPIKRKPLVRFLPAHLAAMVAAWPQISCAVDQEWIGGTGGTWSNSANWTSTTASPAKPSQPWPAKAPPLTSLLWQLPMRPRILAST